MAPLTIVNIFKLAIINFVLLYTYLNSYFLFLLKTLYFLNNSHFYKYIYMFTHINNQMAPLRNFIKMDIRLDSVE